MLHSGSYTALLDACVLYPAPLRDILLSLAAKDLFRPKWSQQIQNEWCSNLLDKRPDLSEEQLQYTVDTMNTAFPDANVTGYQSLIVGLILPDQKDRHVLAAAIKSGSDAIITFNLKDFPHADLTDFDIEALHPDDFICNLIDLEPSTSLNALIAQSARLKSPPVKVSELLDTLESIGLRRSVELFRNLL